MRTPEQLELLNPNLFPEESALLANILNVPWDEAGYLIYADWIDDAIGRGWLDPEQEAISRMLRGAHPGLIACEYHANCWERYGATFKPATGYRGLPIVRMSFNCNTDVQTAFRAIGMLAEQTKSRYYHTPPDFSQQHSNTFFSMSTFDVFQEFIDSYALENVARHLFEIVNNKAREQICRVAAWRELVANDPGILQRWQAPGILGVAPWFTLTDGGPSFIYWFNQ